jgi:hypothetical protein
MASQEKPNYAGLALIVLIGWWLVSSLSGSGPAPDPAPGPTPEPIAVIASEHLTATLEFGAALQQHIKATISKLEAGELTTDKETRDYLAAGRKAAHEAAWQPVKEKDVAAFADGWTPQKQIARLKTLIEERPAK